MINPRRDVAHQHGRCVSGADMGAPHDRPSQPIDLDLIPMSLPSDRGLYALDDMQPVTPPRSSVSSRRPQELPPRPRRLVDRTAALTVLDQLVTTAAQEQTPAVAVLTGMAGVGKTATAIHWLHQRGIDFTDGLLHADLRGYPGRRVPHRRRGLAPLAARMRDHPGRRTARAGRTNRRLAIRHQRPPARPADRQRAQHRRGRAADAGAWDATSSW